MKSTIKILLFFYVSIMAYFLSTHQFYNADIEAYMGIVYKIANPNMSIEEIHGKVYDELKEKNPEKFNFKIEEDVDAIGDSKYYKILSENPKIYDEELQLFTVKPFYNYVNSIFFRLGFSASSSTFIITIISYVLIVLLIFIFLSKIISNNWIVLFLTILISLFKPLLDASRHATPDVLSCLLLLLSVYFLLMKKDLLWTSIFGVLCILTRPDYIVFYCLTSVLAYFFRSEMNLKSRGIFVSFSSFLISFIILQSFNKISWSVLLMNQFVKIQWYPISNPDALNYIDYFNLIKRKLLFEFNSSYFILLLIFIVIIYSKTFSWKNLQQRLSLFFLIIIYLTVFVRFFIFPSLVNRMMVGYYLLIIFTLIYYLNPIYKKIFIKS